MPSAWNPHVEFGCQQITTKPELLKIIIQFNFKWHQHKLNSNQMEDQIGIQSCNGVIRRNPNKQKAKMKSSGGTWIGFTFQLLLYSQTHPGTAK